MKKEELVIKNALRLTREADKHLSVYATKNNDCIKIKHIIKDKEEFDIVNHISVMSIKRRLYPFFVMLIFLNVRFMFNGSVGLQDR